MRLRDLPDQPIELARKFLVRMLGEDIRRSFHHFVDVRVVERSSAKRTERARRGVRQVRDARRLRALRPVGREGGDAVRLQPVEPEPARCPRRRERRVLYRIVTHLRFARKGTTPCDADRHRNSA